MKTTSLCLAAVLGSAVAFQPLSLVPAAAQSKSALQMKQDGAEPLSRRAAISAFGVGTASIVGIAGAAFADEAAPAAVAPPAAAPAPADLGPFPTDWGVTREYYVDAGRMVSHMKYCTALEKGNANLEKAGTNCRKEMIDFVSYYRRFPNISGKLSYSNLYTSINVLAGHYASYGNKFPVPEKRKKRLLQEYTEIEKAIKRKR